MSKISDASHVCAQQPKDRGTSAVAATNHGHTITSIKIGAAADAVGIIAVVVLQRHSVNRR